MLSVNKLYSFLSKEQIGILWRGVFSGMPLVIIYSTIQVWLKDNQIDLAVITTFAVARLPYSFKFIVAPLMDLVKIPYFSRRKGWMIVFSFVIAIIFLTMAFIDPKKDLFFLYVITFLLGIASASLDTNIDAYRIDILSDEKQSIGAANAVFGSRIGILLSGAVALYLSEVYSWQVVYCLLSLSYVIFIASLLMLKENVSEMPVVDFTNTLSIFKNFVEPFKDFFAKEKSAMILLAIILFKLGEAMFGIVTVPFYKELGFSNKEIASIVKTYGLFPTIFGTYVGAWIMHKCGIYKGLMINGVAQSVTNLSFVWLNHQGHDTSALAIAITIENLASGMGSVALIGFLSSLCSKKYSATQYALLASAAGLVNNTITIFGGGLVLKMGWDLYFIMTIILAVPGLLIISLFRKNIS
jgi:PAT family beta-lactamase induction signal transducer AmpG